MATLKALINKDTLRVICETKRVEASYIADKIGCKPSSKVTEWLNVDVDTLPTFNQAKKVANCLHVPFAGLYMKPDDVKRQKIPKIVNRRSRSIGSIKEDSALNIAISDLFEARDLLLSIKSELNEPLIKFNVNIYTDTSVDALAKNIRDLFEIDLNEQFRKTSTRQFYLYVRSKIESKGVFVHCFSDVELELARGLAILDDVMPIIGINENDRPPAKTFSIIHELVHLLKRQSSICNEFYNSFSNDQEEVFCNAVAGEVLVPRDALIIKARNRSNKGQFTVEDIQTLASNFSVSKEVMSRRLLDMGIISQLEYITYNDEFHRLIENEKEERRIARAEGHAQPIPIYPDREAIDRTSTNICHTLLKGFSEDIISKQDISRYLDIGYKYADKFLQEVSKW